MEPNTNTQNNRGKNSKSKQIRGVGIFGFFLPRLFGKKKIRLTIILLPLFSILASAVLTANNSLSNDENGTYIQQQATAQKEEQKHQEYQLVSSYFIHLSPVASVASITTYVTTTSESVEEQASRTQAIDNTKNNTNALGLRISYPSGWRVDDLGNGTVRFSTPLRTDLMRFTVNVVDLPSALKNITLDKLVELNLDSSGQQLSNFSLIESNVTTISSENQSARKILFTNTNKDVNFPLKFKTMQIFTIKDGQIYTISYVSEDSQYSRYLPTIENMIESITFTKKK